MAIHNIRGREGEEVASKYLSALGFNILTCNWRCSYYEIDIIACKENVLHFIEVKTRHSLAFGFPEESVSRKKFNNLKKAASAFLAVYPQWKVIQFDILSLIRHRNRPDDFFLIEDVYL